MAVILSERIRQSAATGASFPLSLQGHTILLVIQLRVGEFFIAQGNLIFKARRGIPSPSVVSLLDYVLGWRNMGWYPVGVFKGCHLDSSSLLHPRSICQLRIAECLLCTKLWRLGRTSHDSSFLSPFGPSGVGSQVSGERSCRVANRTGSEGSQVIENECCWFCLFKEGLCNHYHTWVRFPVCWVPIELWKAWTHTHEHMRMCTPPPHTIHFYKEEAHIWFDKFTEVQTQTRLPHILTCVHVYFSFYVIGKSVRSSKMNVGTLLGRSCFSTGNRDNT